MLIVWYAFHRPHFHVTDNCGSVRLERSSNVFIAGKRLPAASDARWLVPGWVLAVDACYNLQRPRSWILAYWNRPIILVMTAAACKYLHSSTALREPFLKSIWLLDVYFKRSAAYIMQGTDYSVRAVTIFQCYIRKSSPHFQVGVNLGLSP